MTEPMTPVCKQCEARRVCCCSCKGMDTGCQLVIGCLYQNKADNNCPSYEAK